LHRAQNHANRFSPAAQIEYVIAGEGHVRIDMFDMAGGDDQPQDDHAQVTIIK
jgi:hypothetical protein